MVSYQDKSKTGTFRLGRVESVEVDKDGLVRTCTVQYRIVRSDLPMEDLRIYFKGLTFKSLRVPVQRLVVILPVEEQGVQGRVVRDEDEVITSEEMDETSIMEEFVRGCDNDDVKEVEEIGKNYWIKVYRKSLVKSRRKQKSTDTVKLMCKNYSTFMKCVKDLHLME